VTVRSHVPADPDYQSRVRESFAQQRVMGYLGATLAKIQPGYCEIHLPFRPELCQQDDYIHGGIVGTIADSAAGYAGFSLMPKDSSVLTVEYKLNLIAPARGDLLIAKGHVVKTGKTLVITQAEVGAMTNSEVTQCATMLQTLICLHQ